MPWRHCVEKLLMAWSVTQQRLLSLVTSLAASAQATPHVLVPQIATLKREPPHWVVIAVRCVTDQLFRRRMKNTHASPRDIQQVLSLAFGSPGCSFSTTAWRCNKRDLEIFQARYNILQLTSCKLSAAIFNVFCLIKEIVTTTSGSAYHDQRNIFRRFT